MQSIIKKTLVFIYFGSLVYICFNLAKDDFSLQNFKDKYFNKPIEECVQNVEFLLENVDEKDLENFSVPYTMR